MLYDRSYLGTADALGIRNNNPGNIERTAITWLGKRLPGEGRFEQFDSMGLGLRAMLVDIRGKIAKRGLNTISKIISVWAPPSENDTNNYITKVEEWSGIGRNAVLNADSKSQMLAVTRAMTRMETGKSIDSRLFDTAWEIVSPTAAEKHIVNIKTLGGGEFGGGGTTSNGDAPKGGKSSMWLAIAGALGLAWHFTRKGTRKAKKR